jgi:uncharacterized protein (DUF4415 family)
MSKNIFESFLQDEQQKRREEFMNTASNSTSKELAALKELSDDDIDFSDIPETSFADWQNAVRGRFYRPVKKQLTVRIDADVLEWLKASGSKGYQQRLNQILRKAMLSNRPKQVDTGPNEQELNLSS